MEHPVWGNTIRFRRPVCARRKVKVSDTTPPTPTTQHSDSTHGHELQQQQQQKQEQKRSSVWDGGGDYLSRMWLGSNDGWAADELVRYVLPELLYYLPSGEASARAQLDALIRRIAAAYAQLRDAAQLMMLYAMSRLPLYGQRVRHFVRENHGSVAALDHFLHTAFQEITGWSQLHPSAKVRYANYHCLNSCLCQYYHIGFPSDFRPIVDGDIDAGDAETQRSAQIRRVDRRNRRLNLPSLRTAATAAATATL